MGATQEQAYALLAADKTDDLLELILPGQPLVHPAARHTGTMTVTVQAVLLCTALYCTVLYCTIVLHSTVQFSAWCIVPVPSGGA